MTAHVPAMTAHMRMAALSEHLPADRSPRRGWRAWLPRLSRRRPHGLAAIPERYRLQFLLLADAAMPGAAEADVAAMAGRLADQVRIPKRLLAKLPETADLDRWFRDSCDHIKAVLGELVEAEAR